MACTTSPFYTERSLGGGEAVGRGSEAVPARQPQAANEYV